MSQGALLPLRRIQIGKEATPGTEVAASARLLGEGVLLEASQLIRPERDYGSLAGGHEAPVVVALESKLELTTDASYQQILYPLFTIDEVSPTGAGPYVYIFDSPVAADPDGATFTLEGVAYDGAAIIEQFTAVYGFATEFGLSAAFGANLTEMRSTWVAKSLTAKAPTADPGIPTRTLIPADKWTVKLADTQAGLTGASALAGIVNSFDLTLATAYRPKRRLNCDTEFVERGLKMHQMTLRMTYDLIAGVETERVNFRAGTRRFIRLSVGSGNEIIQIDMCGNILEPPTAGTEEENETREITYVSAYDSTWTKSWSVSVTNNLASLP